MSITEQILSSGARRGVVRVRTAAPYISYSWDVSDLYIGAVAGVSAYVATIRFIQPSFVEVHVDRF